MDLLVRMRMKNACLGLGVMAFLTCEGSDPLDCHSFMAFSLQELELTHVTTNCRPVDLLVRGRKERRKAALVSQGGREGVCLQSIPDGADADYPRGIGGLCQHHLATGDVAQLVDLLLFLRLAAGFPANLPVEGPPEGVPPVEAVRMLSRAMVRDIAIEVQSG